MGNILEGLNASGKIKAVMAINNLKKTDLSDLLGCTPETIGNRLETDNWDYKDLAKIAIKYDIEITDLI